MKYAASVIRETRNGDAKPTERDKLLQKLEPILRNAIIPRKYLEGNMCNKNA